MVVMPEPLLDSLDLYATHYCRFTEPEEVTHGTWKSEDLLALIILNVDEDVVAK